MILRIRTTEHCEASVGAISRENRTRSGHQNSKVKPQRPRLRISKIQPYHVVEGCTASAAHLSQAGDAWLQFQDPASVPNIINLEFVGKRRARPDQRHLASKHIPKLREFVSTQSAKQPSDWCHPRVIGNFVDDRFPFALRVVCFPSDKSFYIFLVNSGVIVHIHRTKLEAVKGSPKLAQALLAEKYRPFRSELDGQRNGSEERGKNKQKDTTS